MSFAPSAWRQWYRRNQVADYGILFLMVSPNLIWILLDRGRWVSDTSLYGLEATRLHHALLHDTAKWWSEMLAISPKPPILPWVGQFFVAVGRFVGNIDIGLLLIIFAAQCAGLWFLYKALTKALNERSLALLGCLAVASAPMFILLSTQFYVQTVQLLAVCWFLYIMVCSKDWDSLLTLLHLAAASAFAMLTIISSPIYCVVPGLIALGHAWTNRTLQIRVRGGHIRMFLVALVFTTLTALWYLKNFDDAFAYGRFGLSWVYGANVRNVFLLKLIEWIKYILYGFAISAFISLLLPWASAIYLRKENRPWGGEATVMLLLAVQIAIILLSVTSAAQQTFRYVLTLVAYFAVLGSWSLSQINRNWLRASVVVALGLQLGIVNLGLYLWDDQLFARNRQRYLAALDAITQATAADAPDTVWLGTGELGVYAFDSAYHASKSDDYYHGSPREYLSIETTLTASEFHGDVEALWKRIEASQGADIVVMRDPPPPLDEGKAHDMWQLVIQGTAEISNRVRRSPKFERMETPESWELEIYRDVGRSVTPPRKSRSR